MSKSQGFTHCPVCKHWVPEEYFIAEYDRIDDVLTRMCYNCARELGATDLPAFEQKAFRYDPTFGQVKCPLCGHKHEDTFEYDNRAKPNEPKYRLWHCGHCGKDFRWFG